MRKFIYIFFIFIFVKCTVQKKEISEPISPISIKLIDQEINNKIIFCDTFNEKAIATLNLTINYKLQIVESKLENIRVKTSENSTFKLYNGSEIERYELFFQEKSFLNKLKLIQNNKNFNNFPYRAKIYIPFELKKCEDNVVN